jgi:hypothetical protein
METVMDIRILINSGTIAGGLSLYAHALFNERTQMATAKPE